MCGWRGTILNVDLSSGKIDKEKLPEDMARDYLGGRGFNIKTLYQELEPGVEPLSPENILVFGTGPLNGTPLGCGRMTVTTKSPQTGFFVEGNNGGFFAPELKFAGYDIIVIRGRADKPVYLWIKDEKVEIRDASHIWGKTTWETDRIIKEELGDPEIQLRYIGPAGENLVNTSIILGNLARAGGRGGAAAVMGSKNLKAIAVRGSGGVKIARPREFQEALLEIWEDLDVDGSKDPFTRIWGLYGSPIVLRIQQEYGTLATNNGQEGVFEKVMDISGEEFLKNYVVKPKACFCCQSPACSHWCEVRDGPYAGTRTEGIQAGSTEALGSYCGISHLPAIIKGHALCNELGIGMFSTGTTIAWAMEAFEKGIISSKDTDGLELRFGNHEAMLQLIRKIAYREGFGDLLADGVKKASEKIGKGSQDFALHVKGLEYTAVEPRSSHVAALMHAVNDQGSDHTRAYPPYPPSPQAVPQEIVEKLPFDLRKASDDSIPDEKGKFLKWLFDSRATLNCLEFCLFNSRARTFADFRPFAKAITAATGMKFSADDLMEVGERVINLERSFNAREGAGRKDDTLAKRYLQEPFSKGGKAGFLPPLEELLDQYYEARGWDPETGVPTRGKLGELGLGEVADQLETLAKQMQGKHDGKD